MNIALIVMIVCTGWVTHSTVGVVMSLGVFGFFLNAANITNLIAISKRWSSSQALCSLSPSRRQIAYMLSLVSNSKEEDVATAISSVFLFRSLGSSVCLALTAAEVQHALRSELWLRLTGHTSDVVEDIIKQITRSLNEIESLEPELEQAVRAAYEFAIGRSLFVCFCIVALALLANLPIKDQRREELAKI